MMLGDKLHTKNKENTRFLVESRQAFYTHVLKVYINFQRKKKTSKLWYYILIRCVPDHPSYCHTFTSFVACFCFALSFVQVQLFQTTWDRNWEECLISDFFFMQVENACYQVGTTECQFIPGNLVSVRCKPRTLIIE